jgi:GDP-mannose 6-dehydrogenase
MNIGVFGLGYVGMVNAACFAKNGHTVFCTDVKSQKVHLLSQGLSPIKEPELENLIQDGVNKGYIKPLYEPSEVILNAEVLIICVGTPSKPDGEVDLTYLKNVISEIEPVLAKCKDKKHLIFRSTVPPGTTQKITENLRNKVPNLQVLFYPEFLREGNAVNDFYHYGRCVIGSSDGTIDEKIKQLLHVNETRPLFLTDYRTAEFSKYADNSFHALKVAYTNEIFQLAKEMQVNVSMANEIFLSDTKLNVSAKYLKPGMPFGGSCLPKDVREIQHLIKKTQRDFPLLKNIIPSNEVFINQILKIILDSNKKNIAFIGLTFKNQSDDLRESPVLKLINELRKEEEMTLSVWDEDININSLRIEFPYLFTMLKDYNDCIKNSDLVVVTKRYLDKVITDQVEDRLVINLSDKIDSDYNNLY